MDERYVIDAVFDGTDPLHGKFCIVWSARRMSTADVGQVIHCDCTYKCAWNGYPITMLGFSDNNRKFHPVILAVSTHETFSECFHILSAWRNVNPKYLMADASEAVFNGAKLIWPHLIRFMCYAHVYMVS
jgi:MULE transposase domain